jgi:hypothetical protein
MTKEYKAPSFHYLWRDDISLHESVPISHKESEPFRKVSELTYNRLVNDGQIDDLLNQEYHEGYNDGVEDALTDIESELQRRSSQRLRDDSFGFDEIKDILDELSKKFSR